MRYISCVRPRAPYVLLLAAMILVPAAALLAVFVWLPTLVPTPVLAASSSIAPPPSIAAEGGDETPQVRGRILDAEGNAVAGATVRLVSPRPPYMVYHDASTDSAGRFAFRHIEPPRVRVVADRDPEGVVSSAELHPQPGETTELTLVLSAAGAVRGTVVDTRGRPVADAALSVEGVPWSVRGASSDTAGSFRVAIVPREATAIVAVARGYRTGRVALAPRDEETELVVQVQLAAASPVDGEVHDPDGSPVRARIVACEGQSSEVRVVSADNGTFQLPPSAIGCQAVAEHTEFTTSDPVAVIEERRVSLRLGSGGSIEGAVVDRRGSGVASFSLGIESFAPARGQRFDGARPPRTFTDARGSFRWDRLAPGRYVLTASAPDRQPARSATVEVAAGAPTRGVRIVLGAGGTVTGRVFDEHHAPIAGVELRFDAVSSVLDGSATAQTDDSGQYRLEGAPAGPFTLRVQREGFRARLVSGLRVASGGTLRQDVTLALLDGGPGLELGGIGATLETKGGEVTLHDVFPGDPAQRAGLRAGDRVVRIDGEPTDEMSLADALQRLRGESGTSVGVTVQHADTGETIDVMIARGRIAH
jgi:protocatechuate 3,4-dioxygenase beta subunit